MTDTATTLTDTIHIPEQPTPSSLRCRHVIDGRRCGSPAMRGERFCYHHHETRRPIAALRQRRARQSNFSVPAPESRQQIQQAIGDIMLRIAGNDIDLRRAGLLLYALQLATCNLNEHQRQNARTAQQNHPAEPSQIPATQQESSPLPSDPLQHPHSSPLAETPAPTEDPRHPEQSLPIASTLLQEKKCHPQPSTHTDPTSLPEKKCHPEQSTHTDPTRFPEKKCHPERSAAESKDLRSAPAAPTLLPEKKCHPEQSTHTDSTLCPEKKCHPERSAAESKDLRSTTSDPTPQTAEHIHYGSGPTPDLQNPQTRRAPSIDFTPPPPVWHRLSPAVGRMLLETLGRHHAGEFPREPA